MALMHMSAPAWLPLFAGILWLALVACVQAQTLAVKHPVMDYGVDPARAEQYEGALRHAMAMTEEELIAFLPDWSFNVFCECPNCYGGVEGNNIFSWTVDRPHEMVCRFCETVYPNPDFPEEHALSGQNLLGDEISFPYHLNEETGVQHFLSTHLGFLQRGWLVQQCLALGRAYQATGNDTYARRVALVLDRLAQRYPHYPVMQNGPRRFQFRASQELPYAWDSGKWGSFHNEIPRGMVEAYDMVVESPAFDELSAERGYDVRERVERDCFRPAFEAAAASPYHVSNVVGYDVTSAAVMGRVLNDPGYVRQAFRWIRRNVDEGFYRDGSWREGASSYHHMAVGGLRAAFRSVEGYTDPPGYLDPVDGTRFDNLDPLSVVPFWAKVVDAPVVVDFPTGIATAYHDTHPYERRSDPRHETRSTILPGVGHASLGRGAGRAQMQAQLHFSGAYGHSHADNLNLTLFAKGREMLPDLGYTWTQMRYWTSCTLGHSLVVVDRSDQVMGASDGDLLWYFPDTAGVAVVDADGRRGYRNTEDIDLYRRMLVMIPVSASDAYVVDIFRVRGGSMHDWTVNGDADEDTTARASLPLDMRRDWMLKQGEEWKEPTMEGHRHHPYGMVRDVAGAATHEPFHVDFRYQEPPEAGVRVHMAGEEPREVWLGRSPSVRRMGVGSRGDMRKGYDYWMPKLLVRRQGEGPLHSLFAAVHEPHEGPAFITSVQRLELTPPDENAVALRITHGDTVDTLISTLDEAPYTERTTPDGMTLRGKLGLVRQVQGQATGIWLFEGEEFRGDGWGVQAATGRLEGTLEAVTRKADGDPEDAFITEADLPAGAVLQGHWLILTYATGFTQGYEIDRVERRGDRTFIVFTEDHGLRMEDGKTQEVYFPMRSFEGVSSFVIPLVAAAVMGGTGG